MDLKNYYDDKPCGIGGSYNLKPLFNHGAMRSWAANHRQQPIRFLDAGCGGALVGKNVVDGLRAHLGVNTGEFVGIDFIRENPNVFSECEPPVQFVEANMDGRNWPLPDNAFDFVLCNHVLEHIFNTEHFVREIHRVLRPGGLCVLNVPNASWWANRVLLLFGMAPCMVEAGSESICHGYAPILKRRWAHCGTAGHIRCITAWALRDLAEYGGLTFAGWWRQSKSPLMRTGNMLSRYIGVIATKPQNKQTT